MNTRTRDKIDKTVWDKIRVETNYQMDCSEYSEFMVGSKYRLEFMDSACFERVRETFW